MLIFSLGNPGGNEKNEYEKKVTLKVTYQWDK